MILDRFSAFFLHFCQFFTQFQCISKFFFFFFLIFLVIFYFNYQIETESPNFWPHYCVKLEKYDIHPFLKLEGTQIYLRVDQSHAKKNRKTSSKKRYRTFFMFWLFCQFWSWSEDMTEIKRWTVKNFSRNE